MLTRAPTSLGAWIQAIGETEIPVLARTALAIDALRDNEDDVAPKDIAEIVVDDPLMTLKLLRLAARQRPARMTGEIETVTAALLMLGTSNFFTVFAGQQTVEALLEPVPQALAGLEHVIDRAHRAGRFAIAFAMARNDTDAEVIREAAMLHGFAEALLWCHAPTLALDIEARQFADPTLRSVQAQRDVLHIELRDLEQAIMRLWQLPELLQHLTNEHLSNVPRVRNVLLATALARHSQRGWDNAALPDDVDAIGRLLNLAPAAVWSLIRELDETAVETVAVAA